MRVSSRISPAAKIVVALLASGVLWGSAQLTSAGQTEWERLTQQARQNYQRGRYSEAEPLARKALNEAQAAFGDESARTASSASNLALVLEKLGRYEDAEAWARHALAIVEKTLGPEHPETADTLQVVGTVLQSRGRYAEAEPLLRRAAEILEKTLGPGHPATAMSQSSFALLLDTLGHSADAESLSRRAVTILENTLGAEDANAVIALDNYAAVLRGRGQYDEAERAGRQAVSRLEKTLGRDHPVTLNASNSLAFAVAAQARFAEAEALYRRNLALAEKILGPEHPGSAVALGALGTALREQGRYADAERLYRRALAITEKALGTDHPDTAGALHNLASLVKERGHYSAAEELYGRALSVLEKALGSEHPRVAATLNGQGLLLETQARYREAEQSYRRALAIQEKAFGGEHPNIAITSHNLAVLLRKQGRYADARPLYQRAIAIWEKAFSADFLLIAGSVGGLGVIYASEKQYAAAEPLLQRAVAIRERTLGPEHPATAISLYYLAMMLEAQGRYAEAEPVFRRAAAISDNTGEPLYRVMHNHSLGRFLARRGRPQEALAFYLRSADALDWLFAQTRGQSDETRYSFLGQFADVYRELIELLLLLHENDPSAGYDRQVLAAISRNQSRIFSELLRQADVTRFSKEPVFLTLKGSRDDLLSLIGSLRERRASIAADETGAQARKDALTAQLKAAGSQLAAAEAQLRRDYPRFMELVSPLPVTAEELQRTLLRPREALVTYALLEREIVVIAVTQTTFRLQRVPVPRAELARRLHAVRRALEESGERLQRLRTLDPVLLHGLHRMLIAPIEDVLEGSERVIVIADGPLYALPLELFVTRYDDADARAFVEARVNADGSTARPLLSEYGVLRYFGDHRRLTYYPSLGALTAQRLHRRAPVAVRHEFVAFADPLFADESAGRADRTMDAYSPATRSALQVLTRSMRRDALSLLPRLPETADEARSVADLLGGKGAIYLRERAQERTVKTLDLMGVRYLLFSTHGLLGGEFLPTAQSRGGAGVYGEKYVESATESQAQPALVLTLVGDLGGEDGLLTMKDVIEDLSLDVDMVVLSACNTAGNPDQAETGEGFAGLARAFLYAGARRLLVSHWPVESLATRDLIVETFRGLQRGLPAGEALARARIHLRESVATSKGQEVVYSRSHPFYWAPFVVVGD